MINKFASICVFFFYFNFVHESNKFEIKSGFEWTVRLYAINIKTTMPVRLYIVTRIIGQKKMLKTDFHVLI